MSGGDADRNIARAIRRSQRLRAGQQRRRRRSVALISLLAVTIAGGSIWSIGAATGNDMVEAVVTKAQSIADLIGQRSPGARTEAQLTKTTHERALAKLREASRQHVTQSIASPKRSEAKLAQFLQALPLTPGAVDLERPLPLAELGAPPPFPGAILFPGGAPESGMPGASQPPGTVLGTQQPPIVSPPAVPEPQTWAMMLLGFCLIGWRCRRNSDKLCRA